MTGDAIRNVMSIDVEDWFCVYNLSQHIRFEDWDKQDSRVEQSTLRLLDMFSRHRVSGTFFVLGWVADRFPDLVREIDRRGHEIATHGYAHRLLTHMTADEFRTDLLRSLEVIERSSSQRIRGHRAPSFSVTRKTPWAAGIMREAGLTYDSSVFPVGFHPDYGIGDAPLTPYWLTDGLREVPMSCAEVGSSRVPCSGGGYFRQYPYALTRWLMRRCNAAGRPVIFYLHPWEVDPDQPRIEALGWSKKFRHYRNLAETENRMERMLEDFRFGTVAQLLEAEKP
ncbi:polysaccharide deacetylase (plasmid) [Bryobacterales bacterium F-183]|nr:polysaccharide deacetylase [Bryobacterales bacterium F-183]